MPRIILPLLCSIAPLVSAQTAAVQSAATPVRAITLDEI